MAFSRLHDTDYPIEVATAYNNGTGYTAITSANIKSADVANSFELGAIVMTTDTFNIYKHNGTMFEPVQSLDMAMTKNGEILVKGDKILYKY